MQDKEDRLRRLVREAAGPAEPSAPAVRIEGSHNIVGDGNTVIHAHAVRQINRIDPTKGELTEAQKSKLTELLNAWISAHNTIRVRAKPLTHAAAWSSFKKTA